MNRLTRVLIPCLAIALLGFVPDALAQVTPERQPTQAEMKIQQDHMQERMQRLQRDVQDLERRAPAVRDAELRAELQRDMERIQTAHQEMQQEIEQLGTMTRDEYADAHRAAMERMHGLEADVHTARLRAAETPAAHRQVVQQQLERQRDTIGRLHQHVAELPAEERGEAAYELIQLRTQHDDLANRHRRAPRPGTAAFGQHRTDITRDLVQFERNLHQTAHGMDMHVRMDAAAQVR